MVAAGHGPWDLDRPRERRVVADALLGKAEIPSLWRWAA